MFISGNATKMLKIMDGMSIGFKFKKKKESVFKSTNKSIKMGSLYKTESFASEFKVVSMNAAKLIIGMARNT